MTFRDKSNNSSSDKSRIMEYYNSMIESVTPNHSDELEIYESRGNLNGASYRLEDGVTFFIRIMKFVPDASTLVSVN